MNIKPPFSFDFEGAIYDLIVLVPDHCLSVYSVVFWALQVMRCIYLKIVVTVTMSNSFFPERSILINVLAIQTKLVI